MACPEVADSQIERLAEGVLTNHLASYWSQVGLQSVLSAEGKDKCACSDRRVCLKSGDILTQIFTF